MTTKVRVQESLPHSGYKHMYISLLVDEGWNGKEYLKEYGQIKFQYTVGNEQGHNWYGMEFLVVSDKPEYFAKVAKISKYILDNRSSYSAQPDEILHIIGAKRYTYDNVAGLVPDEYVGKIVYRVMVDGDYKNIVIAANELLAQKQVEKLKLNGDVKLVSDHVITKTELVS